MAKKTQKTNFWLIIATINTAALIYPVVLCAKAESNNTHFLAAILLLGTAFLLAIADTMSVILAYM